MESEEQLFHKNWYSQSCHRCREVSRQHTYTSRWSSSGCIFSNSSGHGNWRHLLPHNQYYSYHKACQAGNCWSPKTLQYNTKSLITFLCSSVSKKTPNNSMMSQRVIVLIDLVIQQYYIEWKLKIYQGPTPANFPWNILCLIFQCTNAHLEILKRFFMVFW